MTKTDNLRAILVQKVEVPGGIKIYGETVYSVGMVQLIDWEDTSSEADEPIPGFFVEDGSMLALLAFTESLTGTTVIETNNASSPDNTISVTSEKPCIYGANAGFDNPITAADCTKLFLTNTTANAHKFRAFAAHTNLGD